MRERAHSRRKLKAFKVKLELDEFIVGRDITLEKVDGLSKRALVGRMEYVKMNRVEFVKKEPRVLFLKPMFQTTK